MFFYDYYYYYYYYRDDYVLASVCVQHTSDGLPMYRAVRSTDEPSLSAERGRKTPSCCRLCTAGSVSVTAVSQTQRPRPSLPHDSRNPVSTLSRCVVFSFRSLFISPLLDYNIQVSVISYKIYFAPTNFIIRRNRRKKVLLDGVVAEVVCLQLRVQMQNVFHCCNLCGNLFQICTIASGFPAHPAVSIVLITWNFVVSFIY